MVVEFGVTAWDYQGEAQDCSGVVDDWRAEEVSALYLALLEVVLEVVGKRHGYYYKSLLRTFCPLYVQELLRGKVD